MSGFLPRRLAMMPVTALAAVTLIFVIMHTLPGDPALAMLGENATEERVRAVRDQLGLNQLGIVQYGQYMWGLVRGDLGRSLITGDPTGPVIARSMLYTAMLAATGVVIGLVIGIPAGIYAAIRRNSPGDHIIRLLVLAGIASPSFVTGLVLLLIFAVWLAVLPLTGGGSLESPVDLVWHGILPALTFGIGEAVFISRLTRSSMLETLSRDFVRTAHAKGLSHRAVTYRHALRNSLIPVVTFLGVSIGRALAGSAVIETVFVRPGMGSLFVQAAQSRDYPLAQSTLVVFAVLIVASNAAVDVAYAWIDPRLARR
jgi:peptide/nickel transport system permease protein